MQIFIPMFREPGDSRELEDMDDKAWLQLFIQLTGGYADVVTESRSRTNLSTLEPDSLRCMRARVLRLYKSFALLLNFTFNL